MNDSTKDHFILSSRTNQNIALTIYRPSNVGKPTPVIVMGHGIGAIKAGGLSAFALSFVSAGYAAVAFDYLSFGASQGFPRNVLNVEHELQDFRDVLAWVRNDEQNSWVDHCRIVAWGTSFGGMHVTALMSEDHDLAAGIAQCPAVDGFACSMQIPLLRSLRLTITATANVIGSLFGAKPRYVPLTSDGSIPAIMASREVVEGWARIAPENGEPWPNILAGRSLFISRPLFQVHKSTRPYLIVLTTWDNEVSLTYRVYYTNPSTGTIVSYFQNTTSPWRPNHDNNWGEPDSSIAAASWANQVRLTYFQNGTLVVSSQDATTWDTPEEVGGEA